MEQQTETSLAQRYAQHCHFILFCSSPSSHLCFCSSDLVVFFIMANFKQQAMYRQCVPYFGQPLWQLQTQLSSSQLRMAKSFESLKQVMPFSTFSPRFSPPLPLSVHLHSPHTSLIHSSYLSGEASVLRQHGEGEETTECQFNNCLNGLVLDEATNTCFVVDRGDHHVIKKITF